MILDHKMLGILDQGRGQLIIHPESHVDETYKLGIDVIANMGEVVTSLFRRADSLTI